MSTRFQAIEASNSCLLVLFGAAGKLSRQDQLSSDDFALFFLFGLFELFSFFTHLRKPSAVGARQQRVGQRTHSCIWSHMAAWWGFVSLKMPRHMSELPFSVNACVGVRFSHASCKTTSFLYIFPLGIEATQTVKTAVLVSKSELWSTIRVYKNKILVFQLQFIFRLLSSENYAFEDFLFHFFIFILLWTLKSAAKLRKQILLTSIYTHSEESKNWEQTLRVRSYLCNKHTHTLFLSRSLSYTHSHTVMALAVCLSKALYILQCWALKPGSLHGHPEQVSTSSLDIRTIHSHTRAKVKISEFLFQTQPFSWTVEFLCGFDLPTQ